jgi:methyl-accepting chemotaxis protein
MARGSHYDHAMNALQRLRHQLFAPFSPAAGATLALAPGLLILFAALLAPGPATIGVGLIALAIGHALYWAGYKPAAGTPAVDELPEVQALTLESLADLSTRIHVTADGLVRAAQAIAAVTQEQAQGTQEQAEVLRMTNAMMDEFLSMATRINDQARLVTQTANHSADISHTGQVAIQQAIQGMTDLRRQVTAIAETITRLAGFTRRIDQIVSSVGEIATQSTLLALNASIEAARAGTQGRGFAVVADEVRALASQSTDASKQIRVILGEIQAAVQETINATQAGLQGVDTGLTLTQQADQVMVQLNETVLSSNRAVKMIYDVIRQQIEGLEGISINIERVDRITQQTVASTRLVDTVSSNLNRLAEDLHAVVTVGERMGGRD